MSEGAEICNGAHVKWSEITSEVLTCTPVGWDSAIGNCRLVLAWGYGRLRHGI